MSDLVQGIAAEQRDSLLAVNEQLVLAMLQATVDAEGSAERLSEATRSAHLDPLTGLPDRVVFLDRFTQAITQARRHGSRLGVLFVDLDRFKEINDTLGHGVGDRILCASARALASTVREADTVSRHGGDEFLVLLTEISDASGAEVIARKLCDAISGSSEIAALGVRLTASIGVSVYPNDGQDARTLIDRADAAMYRAKKARICVATASLVDERPLHRGTAEDGAVVAECPQPRRAGSPGDELHRQLREANERLLIAALDAQSSEKGSASAPAYRALIDHMEDGAISVDGDGKLLFCNLRFAGLIDIDRGELVGTPFAGLLANDDEAQAFLRLLARGSVESASENFTLLNADGSGVPVNITLVDEQAFASDSPLRVVSGIVTDLRQHGPYGHAGAALAGRLHRAVIERGRAERRLEATLDAAGMGGLEVDLDSGVLGWIRRHDRFFGGTEVNHVALSDLFAQVVPEDRAIVERAFADAARSGVIDVEHRIV